MANKLILGFMLVLILIGTSQIVLADEEDEVTVFGDIELEKLLNIGSSLIALILSIITFFSYSRNGNKRLLFVGSAFLLFAIKSFLVGAEIFFGEWVWVDPVSSIMDFVILATFFLGILKK